MPPAGIAIDLQRGTSRLGHVGIELVVPTAEERVGDVQPPAVEAELQHLRAAGELRAAPLRAPCRARRRARAGRSASGSAGSLTSYCRMSPCSQLEKYSQRSSIDSTRSVIRPGTGNGQPFVLDRLDLDHLLDLPLCRPPCASATSCSIGRRRRSRACCRDRDGSGLRAGSAPDRPGRSLLAISRRFQSQKCNCVPYLPAVTSSSLKPS